MKGGDEWEFEKEKEESGVEDTQRGRGRRKGDQGIGAGRQCTEPDQRLMKT